MLTDPLTVVTATSVSHGEMDTWVTEPFWEQEKMNKSYANAGHRAVTGKLMVKERVLQNAFILTVLGKSWINEHGSR